MMRAFSAVLTLLLLGNFQVQAQGVWSGVGGSFARTSSSSDTLGEVTPTLRWTQPGATSVPAVGGGSVFVTVMESNGYCAISALAVSNGAPLGTAPLGSVSCASCGPPSLDIDSGSLFVQIVLHNNTAQLFAFSMSKLANGDPAPMLYVVNMAMNSSFVFPFGVTVARGFVFAPTGLTGAELTSINITSPDKVRDTHIFRGVSDWWAPTDFQGQVMWGAQVINGLTCAIGGIDAATGSDTWLVSFPCTVPVQSTYWYPVAAASNILLASPWTATSNGYSLTTYTAVFLQPPVSGVLWTHNCTVIAMTPASDSTTAYLPCGAAGIVSIGLQTGNAGQTYNCIGCGTPIITSDFVIAPAAESSIIFIFDKITGNQVGSIPTTVQQMGYADGSLFVMSEVGLTAYTLSQQVRRAPAP